MAKIGAFRCTSLSMGFAKGLRFGPSFKSRVRIPDRMGCVERVIFASSAAQKVERAKTWHFIQIRFALTPKIFKGNFAPESYLKTVHCNIHGTPWIFRWFVGEIHLYPKLLI